MDIIRSSKLEIDMNNNRIIHYQWLDLLRFLAAFLVVLSHVRGFLFSDYGSLEHGSRGALTMLFYAFTRVGHEAVIVFFVLSGYLVGGKALERIAKGTFQPMEYVIDRISRIWLPLLPALVLSACIVGGSWGVDVWFGNFFCLQDILVPPIGDNRPLWSLAYEVWFYVIIYSIGRQVAHKSIDPISFILLVLFFMVFTKLSIQYLACWLIGAMFYIRPHSLSNRSGLVAAGFVSLFSIVGLQLTSGGYLQMADSPTLRAGLEILLAGGAGLACVTLVKLRSNRISNFAPSLAAFSYTLYLTHYPLLVALRKSGWNLISVLNARAFGLFILAVAICLIVAWLLYLVFERNTGKVRSFLKIRVARTATVV